MAHLVVWRPFPKISSPIGYWHHGVLCPDDHTVIHYARKRPSGDFQVQRTPLSRFVKKAIHNVSPCVYTVHHPKVLPTSQVVSRAQSKLGLGGYNLAFNNCEHFARWCMLGHASISRQAACIGGAFVAGIVMAGPVTAVAAVLSERYVCGIREMHPNYTPFHFHYALENQAQYYDDGNNNGMFQRRMQTDFASTDAYGPESQQQSVAGGFDVGSHSLFYPQPSR